MGGKEREAREGKSLGTGLAASSSSSGSYHLSRQHSGLLPTPPTINTREIDSRLQDWVPSAHAPSPLLALGHASSETTTGLLGKEWAGPRGRAWRRRFVRRLPGVTRALSSRRSSRLTVYRRVVCPAWQGSAALPENLPRFCAAYCSLEACAGLNTFTAAAYWCDAGVLKTV